MKSKIDVLNRVENTLKEANKFYEKYNEEFNELKSEILKIVEPMSYDEAKKFFEEFDKVSDFKFKFYLPEGEILEEKKKKEFTDDDGLMFFKQIAPLKKFLNKEQLNELDSELRYSRKFRVFTLYRLGLKEDEVLEIVKFLCENNILIRTLYMDCPECEDDTISINEEVIDTYNKIKALKEKETLSSKERSKLWSLESSLEELTTFGCCERELTKEELEQAINDYKNYKVEFFDINKEVATNL